MCVIRSVHGQIRSLAHGDFVGSILCRARHSRGPGAGCGRRFRCRRAEQVCVAFLYGCDGCRDVRVLIFTGPQSVKVQSAARQLRVVRFCVCQRLVDLRIECSGRQLFVPVLFRRLRALLVVRNLRLYLLRVQPFKLADGLVGGAQLLLQAVGTCRSCVQVRLWSVQLVDFCLQLFFQLPGVGVTQQLFGKFQRSEERRRERV